MYANILENGDLCISNEDFGNGIFIENFDPDKYYYMNNGKIIAEQKCQRAQNIIETSISEELKRVVDGI